MHPLPFRRDADKVPHSFAYFPILGGQMGDLLYEVNDHIGLVTLNRPDAMNSLTYQLYADL